MFKISKEKELNENFFFDKSKFMRRYTILLLFFVTIFFRLDAAKDSGSVFLMNDSPFLLRASVQSAGGQFLGGIRLAPGEQKLWTSEFKPSELRIPGTPDVSLTPFTVIWRCEEGGFYSMCTQASPGALIRASACPGAHFCSPKEKVKEPPPCECICPDMEKK